MRKHKRFIVMAGLVGLVHVTFVSGFVSGGEAIGSRDKRSGPGIVKNELKSPASPSRQPCDELLEDDAITASTDDEYKFNQGNDYWAVVGLRPDPGSDWDISLYSDSCGAGTEYAYSWSYEDSTEFVVADYNHSPMGWEGIWIGQYAGTGGARVEYENSVDVLVSGPNTGLEWPAGDVVEIWDVDLVAGSHPFALNVTSGTADLGIAIFASNDSPYYAGRFEAAAASDIAGPGGTEYFEYIAPRTDRYGLVVWSNDANGALFDIQIDALGIGGGTGPGTRIPAAFALSQNHPNPFNPSTVISYQLPEKANVSLTIHDIRGRVVRELVSGFREAGSYSVQWDGKGTLGKAVPSGIYFYRLDTDRGFRSTRKMVILK